MKKKMYPVKDVKLCDHGRGQKSCFSQLSENAEGCAVMQCSKCGLEKLFTVRSLVGNTVIKKGRSAVGTHLYGGF